MAPFYFDQRPQATSQYFGFKKVIQQTVRKDGLTTLLDYNFTLKYNWNNW